MSSPPPPLPPYNAPPPYDQDTSHLQTLSIFYFIIAGLQLLAAAVFMVFVAIWILGGLLGAAGAQKADEAGAVMGVALFFACLWAMLPLALATFAFLNFKTGMGLRRRKNMTLCFVMAVFACLNFGPLGIILGVFTFIVLSRPSVKASFT